MPWAVDNLTPKDNIVKVNKAISTSIGQCMDEGGREQDQCIAIAISKAEEATGRTLAKPKKK